MSQSSASKKHSSVGGFGIGDALHDDVEVMSMHKVAASVDTCLGSLVEDGRVSLSPLFVSSGSCMESWCADSSSSLVSNNSS